MLSTNYDYPGPAPTPSLDGAMKDMYEYLLNYGPSDQKTIILQVERMLEDYWQQRYTEAKGNLDSFYGDGPVRGT